ncbi:MAG: hypothetical protein MUC51_13005 [Anaerolineae bacterium]|jgi:hypothetical protein|nr:hypothetical protein [Anaerolineae bacterium]
MHHKITHAMVGIVVAAFIGVAVVFGLVTVLADRNAEAGAVTRKPVIPLIAHPVNEEMSDCAGCHAVGKGGMPPSHTTYSANTCLTCHRAASPAELAAQEQTQKAAEGATATPEAGAAPGGGRASPVPHLVGGAYTNCSGCHAIGGNRAMPENHAAYTNEMCVNCHVAPTAAEGAAAATAAGGAVGGGPLVPHDSAGQFVNCDTCHALDMGRLAMPQNHQGFTKETCTNCHKPANE